MLAGGHADGPHAAADSRVAEHVVGVGGFLDPPQAGRGELVGPVDGLADVPHLVGVGHQLAVVADLLAHHLAAAAVGRHVDAHLGLEAGPPVAQRGLAAPAHFVLRVAEPARGGDVGGIAVASQLRQAVGTPRPHAGQHLQRPGLVHLVAQVPEVDAVHELGGLQVRHQLPHRHAALLGPQVPHCVHQRGGSEVDDALVRAEPAQLRVVGDRTPERAHVVGEVAQAAPHHQRGQRLDGRAAQVVAGADGERHPVALVRPVGVQHDIGGGVVGVRVVGIRPVEELGRARPQVVRGHSGDRGHRLCPTPGAVW